MPAVYFKPYSNRQAEKKYFNFLLHSINDLKHVRSCYELPHQFLDKLISTSEILNSIERCNFISQKKKMYSKKYLSSLPKELKVAKDIKDISIDFVIENKNELTFIEFHEEQHHRLSDYRLRPIFSRDNERFEIPRFLQRLIRDIWRWKNLSNFKIIWHNWFEQNDKALINFVTNKNEEFVLSNKFSISSL